LFTITTAPRTQNKHDQLIDQLIPCWRACTAGVGEKREKTFFFAARTSLDNRSTYDGHFLALLWHKKWRDLNRKPLVSQLSTWPLLLRSSGNVETVLIPTAPWYVLSSNKRTSFWSKLYCPTEGGNGTAVHIYINA
jgi:hypothetical protein